jgi:alpha-beta hydrolase superfamily lysophospholipase
MTAASNTNSFLVGAGATDNLGVIGWSHGASVAIQYAAANPTTVKWMVLGIPALDLQYLRVTDTVEGIVGLRASIDAAWSVTYPAALPANASPMDRAAGLSGVPALMFTASDDDISTNHATWRSAHGNTTHVNLGALGHTLAALLAIDTDTVVNFVDANS